MPAPASLDEFLDLVRKSGVSDEKRLDAHVQRLRAAGSLPAEPAKAAGVLVKDGFLTHFQAENIMQGKWRRFTIGKYKVLEKIGSGGMGQVYLCEHKLMRRRVAVKVLPTAKATDDAARERFYREARAVAALDHPNIVHAYDIDQDDTLHFLVMEYVDGASLQDIVKKSGPLSVQRACHYMHQAALGLEHAHQADLVHRDIKPGNILVDRSGVVKILDMGLARFFSDEDDILTKKYDENVLGTADYLAPEQAMDSHGVDIRADIYSLGATFFFILTGKTPFDEGTVAQKLIWHQTRQPKPLSVFRADIPPGLQEILNKMMAKTPADRYSVPAQVADALLPFAQTPIAPPPDSEMPHLSLAATGAGPQDSGASTSISKSPRPGPALSVATSTKPPSNPPQKVVPAATTGHMMLSPPPAPMSSPLPVKPQLVSAPTLSAPAVSAPAAAPTLVEDDKAAWETLATDTDDPAGRNDTAPRSIRAPRRRGEQLAQQKEQRRLRTVVIILASVLGLVVAILLWRFVFGQPAGPNTASGRPPLTVGKDGNMRFKSIQQALRSAQIGDVIELHDAVHEENLVVDPSRGPTDVTVRAAPGKEVRWVSSPKRDEKTLLYLSQAKYFHIQGKGITLDGSIDAKRRVQDLIFITLFSPGLTIEDLQFTNIGQNAVKIMNAQGADKLPIRLHNLSTADDAAKDSVGVALDAEPNTSPAFNDYIEVNQFKGVALPFKPKDNTVLGRYVTRPK